MLLPPIFFPPVALFVRADMRTGARVKHVRQIQLLIARELNCFLFSPLAFFAHRFLLLFFNVLFFLF